MSSEENASPPLQSTRIVYQESNLPTMQNTRIGILESALPPPEIRDTQTGNSESQDNIVDFAQGQQVDDRGANAIDSRILPFLMTCEDSVKTFSWGDPHGTTQNLASCPISPGKVSIVSAQILPEDGHEVDLGFNDAGYSIEYPEGDPLMLESGLEIGTILKASNEYGGFTVVALNKNAQKGCLNIDPLVDTIVTTSLDGPIRSDVCRGACADGQDTFNIDMFSFPDPDGRFALTGTTQHTGCLENKELCVVFDGAANLSLLGA